MTQPLALVCYAKLLPGSQLVNRLQDLGYRVQTVADARTLPACVERELPLVVLAESGADGMGEGIAGIRKNPSTQHVPIIAFAEDEEAELQEAARQAGATLVVSVSGLLPQLKQLLDQALEVP
jgi:CheY-like chemotaxis protein